VPATIADATTIELAASLCARAGLGSLASIAPVALTSSNANFVVTDVRGARAVLRRYRDQPGPHAAPERLRRERWVHETLRAAGAPVPRVLAVHDEAAAPAVLLELVDGEPLGTLVGLLSAATAGEAWRAAGRALAAVHRVDARSAVAAGCESAGIRDPTRSRGLYHRDEALANLASLARSRRDLGFVATFADAVEAARPLYERAALALCQYDAHLWQLLVERRNGSWACAAIVDWEHADLDDPDWDLAQLDVFRFEPAPAVPPAFFAGYGRTPTSPLYVLYRVERCAWVLHRHACGDRWLASSAPWAESFVRSPAVAPRRLLARVQGAVQTLG
jgi:aminoglycoside phosphotransferase (APT) family kinase protein